MFFWSSGFLFIPSFGQFFGHLFFFIRSYGPAGSQQHILAVDHQFKFLEFSISVFGFFQIGIFWILEWGGFSSTLLNSTLHFLIYLPGVDFINCFAPCAEHFSQTKSFSKVGRRRRVQMDRAYLYDLCLESNFDEIDPWYFCNQIISDVQNTPWRKLMLMLI